MSPNRAWRVRGRSNTTADSVGRWLLGRHPLVLLVIAALETPTKGRTHMASTGKKKTTMAKLARESRLRERRLEKEARKEARKHAAAHPPVQPNDASTGTEQ